MGRAKALHTWGIPVSLHTSGRIFCAAGLAGDHGPQRDGQRLYRGDAIVKVNVAKMQLSKAMCDAKPNIFIAL